MKLVKVRKSDAADFSLLMDACSRLAKPMDPADYADLSDYELSVLDAQMKKAEQAVKNHQKKIKFMINFKKKNGGK